MHKMAMVVAVALAGISCSTSVPGPGGTSARYSWVRGELASVFDASLPEVQEAARRACLDVGLVAVRGSTESRAGWVDARMATGADVRVELLGLAPDRTLVKIRVGHIGDRAVSQQLLRHIADQLPGSSPAGAGSW